MLRHLDANCYCFSSYFPSLSTLTTLFHSLLLVFSFRRSLLLCFSFIYIFFYCVSCNFRITPTAFVRFFLCWIQNSTILQQNTKLLVVILVSCFCIYLVWVGEHQLSLFRLYSKWFMDHVIVLSLKTFTVNCASVSGRQHGRHHHHFFFYIWWKNLKNLLHCCIIFAIFWVKTWKTERKTNYDELRLDTDRKINLVFSQILRKYFFPLNSVVAPKTNLYFSMFCVCLILRDEEKEFCVSSAKWVLHFI